MAKNLGRKFATMTEDERRRFALEQAAESAEQPEELAFDEPDNADATGSQYASLRDEVADPEHRDGMSALLDDEQHARAVQKAGRKQPGSDPK